MIWIRPQVDLRRGVTEFDENIYFTPAGKPLTFNGLPGTDGMAPDKAAEVWRNLGYDAHSVMADPMFLDPDNGNYALQPDSPALKLGFQPIDVSRIGLIPKTRMGDHEN